MEFLKREKTVLRWVGTLLWWIGKAVKAFATVLVGGPYRRRATLAVGTVVVVGGYISLVWRVERLLRDLLTVAFGIPAPGKPLAPGTWLTPQNGLWPDVMLLSRFSMGIAGLLVLALIARATMASDDAVRRRELKRVGRPAAMVASTWTVLPFMLHLTNQLSMALAPRPDMLLTAMGATVAGGIIIGLLAWIQPFIVGIGALASLLLRALILLGFIAWPVAWPLRGLDHDLAQTLGRSVTSTFTVAVTAKLLQAIFAFVLIYLLGTIESWWMRPVVFVVGILVVFVWIPTMMLRYADRVMMLPGTLAPSERQIGQAIEQSADRMGRVHTHVETGRERVSEWRADRNDPQTELGDFTGGSSSWWNGWIKRELYPRHSSVEWQRQQQTPMDGAYGPDSEDPDDVSHRDASTDRDGSQWDRP